MPCEPITIARAVAQVAPRARAPRLLGLAVEVEMPRFAVMLGQLGGRVVVLQQGVDHGRGGVLLPPGGGGEDQHQLLGKGE